MNVNVYYTKNGKRHNVMKFFGCRPHFGDLIDVKHGEEHLTLRVAMYWHRRGDEFDAVLCSVADEETTEELCKALQVETDGQQN